MTLPASQVSLNTPEKRRIQPSVNTQSVSSFNDTLKFQNQQAVSPLLVRTRSHNKKRRAHQEEKLRLEYETKSSCVRSFRVLTRIDSPTFSILQEVSGHNHRIRQFLNRISSGLRDYDSLQHASATTPGVNQLTIPRDVFDTFFHDPSAVTGSTRRLRGWRAVEDIHQRINRQRSILRSFLKSPEERPDKPGCLLDDPVDNIIRALGDIEIHKEEIDRGNTEVANVLLSVEKMYKDVKDSYNKTASRVSVLYPEVRMTNKNLACAWTNC